jgi:hypothetical protein
MSAVELALEKVKELSESDAQELLAWLLQLQDADKRSGKSASAKTAQGFARRYRNQPRSTEEWMKELREAETPRGNP